MKVLSLKEPWATLIKNGTKHKETRSWKTSYRGELYIHASLAKLSKSSLNSELRSLLDTDDLHYGYIICKCNLVDCVYMTEELVKKMKNDDPTEYLCGIYEEGRYMWILEDIEPLKKPIPAKGHLGIWNFEIK